jgi:hypothetical protein
MMGSTCHPVVLDAIECDVAAAGLRSVLAAVGKLLAVMHDSGVVHGDLTAAKLLVQQQQEGDPSVVSRLCCAALPGLQNSIGGWIFAKLFLLQSQHATMPGRLLL